MRPSIIYSRLFHFETRHALRMRTDHRCFSSLRIPRPVNCCNLCIYVRHHLWNSVSHTQHTVQQYLAQPTKSTGFLSHLRLRETLTYGLIKQVSRVAQPLVGQTKPQRHREQANWHAFCFFYVTLRVSNAHRRQAEAALPDLVQYNLYSPTYMVWVQTSSVEWRHQHQRMGAGGLRLCVLLPLHSVGLTQTVYTVTL